MIPCGIKKRQKFLQPALPAHSARQSIEQVPKSNSRFESPATVLDLGQGPPLWLTSPRRDGPIRVGCQRFLTIADPEGPPCWPLGLLRSF